METSLFLAKIMGIAALLMGASMVMRREMLMNIFRELATSRALSYILGLLMVIIGLLVLVSHNNWNGGFALIITLMGWIAFLEGTMFLFVSQDFLNRYLETMDNKKIYYSISLGYLVMGSYLAYSGFVVL